MGLVPPRKEQNLIRIKIFFFIEMNNISNWYHIEEADTLDSPALLIYPQRIKENIRILKTMVDDLSRLRPHVKTSKTKEAASLMMDGGIRKFKCATIAEAEMLAQCNAPDVLLAYQPTYPKFLRFINLIEHYPATKFSCLVDNLQSAEVFSGIAVTHNLVLKVYIDLNVGMNRTGTRPGNDARELYENIANMQGLELMGLHAYDGHIQETDIGKRTVLCNDAFLSVEEMRTILNHKGYLFPLLVAGGSSTFQIHSQRKKAEASPGTFIFWDKAYSDSIPEQHFLCAALVLTRVISLPGDTKICIDLGYKSIASENDLQHRVFFLNAPQLGPISHSEEHMVIETGVNHGFKIGDVLYALPVHICPTVALYSHGICISSGNIDGKWKIIARDRKINY